MKNKFILVILFLISFVFGLPKVLGLTCYYNNNGILIDKHTENSFDIYMSGSNLYDDGNENYKITDFGQTYLFFKNYNTCPTEVSIYKYNKNIPNFYDNNGTGLLFVFEHFLTENEHYWITVYNYSVDLEKNVANYDSLMYTNIGIDDLELLYSSSSSSYVSCGNINEIYYKIPELTSYFITIIEIVVPVLLIIMGSIDLLKGVAAQKEDEIKKGQQIFVKRLIIGVLVFFIIIITKFIISLVSDSVTTANIVSCIDCFMNNDCK